MSIFEIIMMVCFGAAWPFSIYRSWESEHTAGKSLSFLLIVLIGYIAGILNKILHSYDAVIWLYLINSIMVCMDIGLFFRNARLERLRAQNIYL